MSAAASCSGVRALRWGLWLGVWWLGSASAWAQAPAPVAPTETAAAQEQSAKYKQEGDHAIQLARPAEALAAYEKAFALHATPALLYNQARAHQALTNYPRALHFLERFAREAPPELQEQVGTLQELLQELRGKVHRLTLQIAVDGATVRVGDRTLGTSPLPSPLEVNAGEATIEVEAEGYRPWLRRAPLPGASASTIEVQLEPVATTGWLRLRANAANATMRIERGAPRALPTEVELRAGEHRIELSAPGHRSRHTTLAVRAGERRDVVWTLEKKTALYKQWWLWTAVGVVAAGSVVAIAAATTERSPGVGTLAPGQVRVP